LSGIQEILLIGVIILAILFLPRIKNRNNPVRLPKPAVIISGKMRLIMAVSVFWPVLMSAFLQPWKKDLVLFVYIGICPVLSGWVLYWVWRGFWNYRR
jgi:hypothetical protein